MASTRATTPPPAAPPFPTIQTTPRPPVALPSVSALPSASEGSDHLPLFRSPSAHKISPPRSDEFPRSDKRGLSPHLSPLSLTGVAAMAEIKRKTKQLLSSPQPAHAQAHASDDSRQTTPNPGVEAVQTLMGVGGMSRVSDAPTPTKLSEPMRSAAEKIQVPDVHSLHRESADQTSPVSTSSLAATDNSSSRAGLTATAGEPPHPSTSQFVAEPAQMTEGQSYVESHEQTPDGSNDPGGNKAFSYPGPPPDQIHQQGQSSGPSRGMSLPGYGQGSPKSPASNKRHKCPYCSTDFTRHHNLKSHLLTHSQEKPYVCQTCQARFRRLHDLKRHTKLHTGERPHTCDKCGRRFARGDALARHNKGPGGCAGRRSSFGGDDDFGPDGSGPEGMDGVDYPGPDDDEDDSGSHDPRVSEPSRKRQQLESVQDADRQIYRQHSSTYPPAPARTMGPPTVVHPAVGATTSHDTAGHPSPAGGGSSLPTSYYPQSQLFAEPGVLTTSPRPLSPNQQQDQHRLSVAEVSGTSSVSRNRSTSVNAPFPAPHFGRSSGARTPPQTNIPFSGGQSGATPTILPPLSTTNPNHHRSSVQSSLTGGPPLMHPQQISLPSQGNGSGPLGGSTSGSLSSHGRSSGSSIRDVAGQDPGDLWTYVRQLEQRFSRMQDEYELRISRLQEEVISLKGQVASASSYSSEMTQRGSY